jgi:hypothetical protein
MVRVEKQQAQCRKYRYDDTFSLCPDLVTYFSTFLPILIGENIDVGHGQLCEGFVESRRYT